MLQIVGYRSDAVGTEKPSPGGKVAERKRGRMRGGVQSDERNVLINDSNLNFLPYFPAANVSVRYRHPSSVKNQRFLTASPRGKPFRRLL